MLAACMRSFLFWAPSSRHGLMPGRPEMGRVCCSSNALDTRICCMCFAAEVNAVHTYVQCMGAPARWADVVNKRVVRSQCVKDHHPLKV